jgi:ABC-type Fe3+-siderophore transport system permease subunit
MLAPARDLLSEAKLLYSAYAEGGIATESLCGSVQSALAYNAELCAQKQQSITSLLFTMNSSWISYSTTLLPMLVALVILDEIYYD